MLSFPVTPIAEETALILQTKLLKETASFDNLETPEITNQFAMQVFLVLDFKAV